MQKADAAAVPLDKVRSWPNARLPCPVAPVARHGLVNGIEGVRGSKALALSQYDRLQRLMLAAWRHRAPKKVLGRHES